MTYQGIPQSHIDDAHALQADSIVELFQITLNNGTNLFLKENNSVSWQGIEWEGIAIKINGVVNSADATEIARPSLVLGNPAGIFSSYVVQGMVNRATVIRKQVLGADILANNNVYAQRMWSIYRCTSLDKSSVTFELRNQLDGPNFLVPARSYLPPEFPAVSL